jgi:hypothetical protein
MSSRTVIYLRIVEQADGKNQVLVWRLLELVRLESGLVDETAYMTTTSHTQRDC